VEKVDKRLSIGKGKSGLIAGMLLIGALAAVTAGAGAAAGGKCSTPCIDLNLKMADDHDLQCKFGWMLTAATSTEMLQKDANGNGYICVYSR
jgi:hypothetical protein